MEITFFSSSEALPQEWHVLCPRPLPLSLSEWITWCFVECQLAAGSEDSWAFSEGSCGSKTCHHKALPVACLAFVMCLASGLWYLTGSVVFATFCGSPLSNYSPAQQFRKKKWRCIRKKGPCLKAILRKTKLRFHFRSCCAQMLWSQTNQCLLINWHLINSNISH